MQMLRLFIATALAATFVASAFPDADNTRSIETAFERTAFVNCLIFSREGVPLSELAVESDLKKSASAESDPQQSERWRVAGIQGEVVLIARLDGSRACTTIARGVATNEIFRRTEQFLLSRLPDGMRFELKSEERSTKLRTHHYRQIADAGLSATLSVTLDSQQTNEDGTAIVSFYYSE